MSFPLVMRRRRGHRVTGWVSIQENTEFGGV